MTLNIFSILRALLMCSVVALMTWVGWQQQSFWIPATAIGLVLLLEFLSYQEGVSEGIISYLNLPQDRQQEIRQLVLDIEQEKKNKNNNND